MLPIRFDLSGVSQTRHVADIRINVKDEYRNLVYLAKPKDHQVPISFIGMPEPTSADIRIVDINELPGELTVEENSFRARPRRVTEAKLFSLPSRSATITDVANTDFTGRSVPLWYKHTIEDGLETTPEILNHEMRPVEGFHYRTIIEDGEVAVFHDLYPSIDMESLRTEAFYIRYTNSLGEQVFSLLEADPTYTKITIIDGINPNKRQYTVRRIGGAYEYRILYSGGGPFFLRIGSRDQIKLQKPLTVRATDSWYLQITDGEVYGRSQGSAEFYSVPEYHLQQFSPVEPVRFTGTRECVLLTPNLVKAPIEQLLLDQSHELQVLVTDRQMNARFAFTSGSTTPTPYWVDRFERIVPEGRVLRAPMGSLQDRGISVHKSLGLIHFPFELRDTDRVFIRAKYENRSFTYLNLNLNPLHSRVMIGGRAVVYCIPENLVDENLRSIYHFILDEDNNIIQWNDDRLGEDGVLDPSLVPGVDETGYQLFRENFGHFLILGLVGINRNISPTEIAYIDVRERGGVLTDQTRRDLIPLLEDYPELQWVEDESLHARPFPGRGAFVLDVPFEVLEDAGGIFTEDNVRGIVEKHMALGGYPSIRYYADTPRILGIEYDGSTSELSVTWSEVDHADSYRIYIGEDAEGPYLSVDPEVSAGELDESLSATIGLAGAATVDVSISALSKLYIYIAPLKNLIEWPASHIAYVDLTTESGAEFFALDAVLVSRPTATATLDAILVEE